MLVLDLAVFFEGRVVVLLLVVVLVVVGVAVLALVLVVVVVVVVVVVALRGVMIPVAASTITKFFPSLLFLLLLVSLKLPS